jgi:hypothetical protein
MKAEASPPQPLSQQLLSQHEAVDGQQPPLREKQSKCSGSIDMQKCEHPVAAMLAAITTDARLARNMTRSFL